MEHWHKGKIVTLEKVKAKKQLYEDSKAEYVSHRYEGDKHGFNETNITIYVGRSGSLSFANDGEGFIYLYPEQVKHLRKILRVA